MILPVFNQANLLRESIESVLAQDHADLELIIIDDGSTDGIDEIFALFENHPKVRLLTQPNKQLPAALSHGFAFARGEFRTWTSADNLMEKGQLTRLLAFLRERPDCGMVYADYLVIDDMGRPLSGSDFRPEFRASPESAEIHLPRDTQALSLLQDNYIGACFLYRSGAGRALGDYSAAMGIEDYDYWMRLQAGFGIEHLGTNEILYRYRWHANSLNARAREIRLFALGQRLMATERERQVLRARPWCYLTDDDNRRWLDSANPGQRAMCFHKDLCGSEDKSLAFLSPESLDPEDLDRLPVDLIIALDWDGQKKSILRWSARLNDHRLIHLVTDPDLSRRLAIFTDSIFEVARGKERMGLCEAIGHERIYDPRSRHGIDLPLPRPWTRDERKRRLLVLDGLGHSKGPLSDLGAALETHGFAVEVKGSLEPGDAELILSDSVMDAQRASESHIPFVVCFPQSKTISILEYSSQWAKAGSLVTAFLFVCPEAAMSGIDELGIPADKVLVLDERGPTNAWADVLAWIMDRGRPHAARPFAWRSRGRTESNSTESAGTVQVSVLMPVLDPDPQQFLAAVDSILDQSLEDIELIIIETPGRHPLTDLLDTIEDPRVSLLVVPRKTLLAAARNTGIAAAQAELIAMMDADDLSHPDRLMKQRDYMLDHPEIGVLGTQLEIMDEGGAPLGRRNYPVDPDRIERTMRLYNPIAQPTVMLRKSILGTEDCYDERPNCICEDYDLWSRLARKGVRFANLDEALLRYRIHSQGMKSQRLRASLVDTLHIKKTYWRDRFDLRDWARYLSEKMLLLLPKSWVMALFKRIYVKKGTS